MIENQYQLSAINATSGTLTVVAIGNVTVHTVNFPIATTGIVKVANGDGSTNIDFPVGSIGSMRLDASFSKGLAIHAAASDSVSVTYQIP